MSLRYSENRMFLENYDKKYIKVLIDALSLFFEEEVEIIAEYDKTLIKYGFKTPVMCGENGNICILKHNSFTITDPQSVETQVEYMNKETKKNKTYCDITLSIEGESLDFLQYICKAGVTKSKGRRSQKEFFGKMYIKESRDKSGDIIHSLSIDKKTIKSGDEDKIHATGSLYNFHSHPLQAYLKYKVDYGVPSTADYIAVYTMVTNHNSIVHFVSSIEGLYAISINPESKILDKLNSHAVIKFIKEKMVYPHEKYQLKDYIDFINKKGLFTLQFIEWDTATTAKIRIKFLKSGQYNSCRIG
jgi:hypothetical protein